MEEGGQGGNRSVSTNQAWDRDTPRLIRTTSRSHQSSLTRAGTSAPSGSPFVGESPGLGHPRGSRHGSTNSSRVIAGSYPPMR
jgi:hypothetical protein